MVAKTYRPLHASQVRKNPSHYGVRLGLSTAELDAWIKEKLILGNVKKLSQHGMVRH